MLKIVCMKTIKDGSREAFSCGAQYQAIGRGLGLISLRSNSGINHYFTQGQFSKYFRTEGDDEDDGVVSP